jgi:hypothetical protein
VNLDSTVGEIALVFVHTSGVWGSQLTAVDNIEVAMKSCHGKFLRNPTDFKSCVTTVKIVKGYTLFTNGCEERRDQKCFITFIDVSTNGIKIISCN